MKNAITHLKVQRAKRNEQYMKVETKHIDTVLSGVSQQIDQINALHADRHEMTKKIVAQAEEIEQLKRKLEKKAAPSAA